MSNSVWPQRRQPTRLPCPWDSPGKNTGVGCHFLLQCMKVKSESEVAQVVSDPQQPHGLQPTRLLHPWDFHLLNKRTTKKVPITSSGNQVYSWVIPPGPNLLIHLKNKTKKWWLLWKHFSSKQDADWHYLIIWVPFSHEFQREGSLYISKREG